MEVRCQSCGESIVTNPKSAEEYKVVCTACGASMMVVPKIDKPRPRRLRLRFPEFRRSRENAWKRVFDPIPRPALYAAGITLALALLSPFWVYIFQERYARGHFLLSDDTTNLVAATGSDTNSSIPLFNENRLPSTSLDEFRGVRLETGRDDLLRRFNLRLQNTRGMEPEIYVGYRLGEAEHISAYFYNNLLKEAFLVFREPRHGLATLQQELLDQFGPPASQNDSPNRINASATGLGVSLGGLDEAGELQRRLGTVPYRRDYIWATETHRVEATVYYQSPEAAQGAMIAVHLVASSWLRSNQPMGGVIVAPATRTPSPLTPGPRDLLR